jgi:hypothetical protein
MDRRISLCFCALLVLATDISIAGGKGSGGPVSVRGYVRKDGTYVPPHQRTGPDGNFQNNWSTYGNYNPYTGEEGKVVTPPIRSPGSSGSTYTGPLYVPTLPTAAPKTLAPIYSGEGASAQPESVPHDTLTIPSQAAPLAFEPHSPARVIPAPRAVTQDSSAAARPLTYMEQQKLRDAERAQFWAKHGYTFNPAYMSAYSMDQKVKDIERAKYWQERGHTFSPEYMTAYSMDQKVKDIERARYWSTRGLNFNPNFMTAYSMDREAERLGASLR